MSGLELRLFSDEHLEGASALLAARHARHRQAEPLLPALFEEPTEAREQIEALWRREGAVGAVAFRQDRLVGYLVGAPADDSIWGANEWVELAGHAVEDAELVRDLYGAAAERWLAEGRGRHYVVVPAWDGSLLDAWSRLSFGRQHAYGIREVPDVGWPDGARRAEPRDLEALLELAPLLARHQLLSPVFSARPFDDDVDELRAEIETEIAAEEIGSLVFERDGRIVGEFMVVPLAMSSLHVGLARPEDACFLGHAVTAPEVRGSGAGLALTQASFAWARDRGYPAIVTDWRVTNLLSSRFWPRRGFRETFLRLYRSIP